VQVNYDFHEDLTPEKMDVVLESYRDKAEGLGKEVR
jgi:NADH:ubiquinone oxidoreductase subunit E